MLPLELFKGEVNCWRNCPGSSPFLLRSLCWGEEVLYSAESSSVGLLENSDSFIQGC